MFTMMKSVASSCVSSLLLLLLLDVVLHTSAENATYGSSQDPSSYANVDYFRPSHISFDFAVNFVESTTSGTVTHTLTALPSAVSASNGIVYFDVWDAVEVSKAEFRTAADEVEAFEEVPFEITTPNPNIGNALAVTLPSSFVQDSAESEDDFFLRFTYSSLPSTTALSWLTPEQTAGKVHPFVYSLCQMNFCRDWAPMMDSPSQKITYDSVVVAPSELVVSMSGNMTSSTKLNETHSKTTFECTEKIPSYQLALIVGDLKTASLSDRVQVLAEEPYLEAAVKEFEDLPAVLDSTEAYLTPYIWGNYSIVVMPPSFPWGGMEHINANQVSHTLLPGDKSMLSIAIHEITHSWFGNDVGCQNWDNFWINEGMNVFMERKVLQDIYGLDFAKIDYYAGNNSMVEQMTDWYGLDDSYSSLFPDIGDDDPENSFSAVPYEKGSQFMFYIESLLGETSMQAFLRAYITEFHGMAISSPQLKKFYEEWVTTNLPENATTIIEMTMWDTWIYEPGVAPVPLDLYTDAVEQGRNLAQQYVDLAGPSPETSTSVSRAFTSPPNYEQYFDFYGSQKLAFVQELSLMGEAVDVELLEFIDSDLNISSNEINPDAKNEWYVLGIKKGYQAVLDPAYKWTGEQGRSAYVRPVFSALVEVGECETAQSWCNDYCHTYNVYVSSRVEKSIVEGCSAAEDEAGDTEDPSDSGTTGEEGGDGEPESGGASALLLQHYKIIIIMVGAILLL